MSTCKSVECCGWWLLEGDRFCGWCGASVVAIGLAFERPQDGVWRAISPAIVSRDSQPMLRLRIEHQGQAGTLHVEHARIEVDVPWLELLLDFADGTELLPGESVIAEVIRLDVPAHDDVTHVAPVRVSTPEGLEASAELRIAPQPRLRFEVPAEPVLLREGRESVVSCALVLERGQTIIQAPPVLECNWCELEFGDEVRFPLELRPEGRSRVPCTLRVLDGSAEWMANTGHAEREGGVSVVALGREDVPFQFDFRLRFALAPRLWLDRFRDATRADHTLIRGVAAGALIDLTVCNGLPGAKGHERLEVRRVETTAPWLRVEGRALPVVLESGQACRFTARVDAGLLGESGVATIFFDTNDGGAREYHLGVAAMEPAEYGGWLVIDFGTSNTCCALVDDETGEVRLLPLEVGRTEGPSEQLPSVVRYVRAVPERVYEVGEGPKALLFDAVTARSIVASAKRRLGRSKFTYRVTPKEQPERNEEMAPWEVARDVYSRVLETATATLAAEASSGVNNGHSHEVQLRRIVMTHPSRFTHHQLADLKRALEAAAEDVLKAPVTVRAMHEPVGAGYDFLGDWKWLALRHAALGQNEIEYSLLVYDFGGGTVDITLMRVTSKRSPRQVQQASVASAPVPAPRRVLTDEQKSASVHRLFSDSRVLRKALREYVLAHFHAVSGKAPVLVPRGIPKFDEAAEDNNRLLDMYVDATFPALSKELLLGDPARWTKFTKDPSVPPLLSLMCGQGTELSDCDVRRAYLFPSAREVGESLLREGLPAEAMPLDEACHPYNYDVTPTVLGAAGDRSLGGDDVTAWLLDLLVHAFEEAVRKLRDLQDVVLPIDADRAPPHQASEARQNRVALSAWAELYKIALSSGRTRPERMPPLIFWVEGKRTPVAPQDLITGATLPALADVEARLVPRMHDTLRVARDMHQRRDIHSPDVVLRVGMASRLPTVAQVLRQAYPLADHRAPERPKECVVTGAGRAVLGVGDGILRIRQARAVTATTTRLGFLENDGRAIFREVIAAGEEVPPEGIRRARLITLGFAGARIFIKENGGVEDRLILPDGSRNPDIEDIMKLTPAISDDVPLEALEVAVLEFHLKSSLELTVTLRIPGVAPMDFSGEVGRNE